MNRKPEIDQRVVAIRNAMGCSLWEAQGVEQMVAKFYSMAFKLSGSPSLEEIEREFEKSFSHTAGVLVRKIKNAANGKDVAAEKLDKFVKERN